jgi:hypothetical protein
MMHRNGNVNTAISGYASRAYAESLAEFGAVRHLPACGGWLLATQIPGSERADGMGCYPLFCCHDWRGLRSDLESLAGALVSVRIVTDPFADIDVLQLEAAFPDICYVYKEHFVTDLTQPLEVTVANHHRRNVRRSLRVLTVRESTRDADLLANWQSLYGNLIGRHAIAGIAKFSPQSFERQVTVPGFAAFSALEGSDTCGATLWYVKGDVAYYHLGAYNDRGYALGASFALFWSALSYFAERGVHWAALGAGAGLSSAESGLTRFKRGWATHTRPVYFCGRILQPAVYAKLVGTSHIRAGFFPAYRAA